MKGGELGRNYEDEEVVFREGEQGAAMYVIQSGGVRLTKETAAGEYVLATLEEGEIFGEMALFDRKPRSATATATGPTRILTVDRDKLFRSVGRDPTLLFKILETLTRRLRRIDDDLAAAEKFRRNFLHAYVDVEVTCRLILEEAKNLTQAENGSIMLFDDEGKRLVLTAAYGSEAESKTPLRRGEGIAGEVAKTGEALLVPDTSQDPRFLSGEFRVQSLACAPLIFEGTIFGVINMSNSSGRELTTREFEILQSLGLFASLAIHNATHFSRVHRAAEEVFRKASLLDY